MKILIVYEEIPESTKIYSVEVTPDEWEWMKLTHGHYVNAGDSDEDVDDACNTLSTWLEGRMPIETPHPIPLCGASYDYVVVTGFIL